VPKEALKVRKTYTATERSWLRLGMGIGGEFGDHGKQMRVVKIGKPYRPPDEKENLIDVEAIPVNRRPIPRKVRSERR